MKKIVFLLGLCFVGSVQAMVAPEIFDYEPTCPKDKPFIQVIPERGTECQSCDSLRGLMLKKESDCQRCPHRERTGNGECRLKKCPATAPYYESKWNWSGCKNCQDEPTHITKDECLQCPNMRWVEGLNLCAPNKKGVIYYDGESLGQGRLIGGVLPYSFPCDNSKKEKAIRAGREECCLCPHTKFQDGWCYSDQKGNSNG